MQSQEAENIVMYENNWVNRLTLDMPQNNPPTRENIADKRNQIILALKNLEHGMSEFHGQWVFEAVEEDLLCEIIDEALLQIQRETVEAVRLEERNVGDDTECAHCGQHIASGDCDCVGFNEAVQDQQELINKLGV